MRWNVTNGPSPDDRPRSQSRVRVRSTASQSRRRANGLGRAAWGRAAPSRAGRNEPRTSGCSTGAAGRAGRPVRAELGAFTHTDPWRVLRIQGEFVDGINALAEVGAAVSVFGSARFAESHPMYAGARRLGAAPGRGRLRRDHRRRARR